MKRTDLLNLLEATLIFMILYSLILILLNISNIHLWDGSIKPIYKSFILYLFMLSMLLFRKKFNNIFAFSLNHALLIVFALLLGSAFPEKIVYILFTFAITVISLKIYLSESKNAYTLSLLLAGEIILFFIFLITLFKDDTLLQPLLNILSVVYIILFMLYTRLSYLDNALTHYMGKPVIAIIKLVKKT